MTELSIFEWTEEFPMGSNDISIGSFRDSEIDLSDNDATSGRRIKYVLFTC